MLGKKVAPEEPSLYPFIVFGQSHARFPPPALPGLLTAHQLLFLLGSGEWGLGAGFPSQLVARLGHDAISYCALVPVLCLLNPLGRETTPPLSGLREGVSAPVGCTKFVWMRRAGVCGKVVGTPFGWGWEGPKDAHKELWFPLFKKVWGGGCLRVRTNIHSPHDPRCSRYSWLSCWCSWQSCLWSPHRPSLCHWSRCHLLRNHFPGAL